MGGYFCVDVWGGEEVAMLIMLSKRDSGSLRKQSCVVLVL